MRSDAELSLACMPPGGPVFFPMLLPTACPLIVGIKHRRQVASVELHGEPGHEVVSMFENLPARYSSTNYRGQDPLYRRAGSSSSAAAALSAGGLNQPHQQQQHAHGSAGTSRQQQQGRGAPRNSSSAGASSSSSQPGLSLESLRQLALRELAHHAGVGPVYQRASERFSPAELQWCLQELQLAATAADAGAAAAPAEQHMISSNHACALVAYCTFLLQRELGLAQHRPVRAAQAAQQQAQQQQPAHQQQQAVQQPPEQQQQQVQQQQQQAAAQPLQGHQQQQQVQQQAQQQPAPALRPPLSVLVLTDLPLTFGAESAACTSALTCCLRQLGRCDLLKALHLRWSRRTYFDILRQGGKQLERMSALWGRATAALQELLGVSAWCCLLHLPAEGLMLVLASCTAVRAAACKLLCVCLFAQCLACTCATFGCPRAQHMSLSATVCCCCR
jgi:hypothetical protein